MSLSREAIVRGLVEKGVPRAAAELQAARELELRQAARDELGLSRFSPFARADRAPLHLHGSDPPGMPAVRELTWPVHLTLPWSVLVSDNDRTRARLITRNGKPCAIEVITPEYASAKVRILELATEQLGDVEPAARPCRLEARVYVPDRRPHDVPNFGKLVHDALEGVVYTTDTWLWGANWWRAGVDVDRPRAELTVWPVPE